MRKDPFEIFVFGANTEGRHGMGAARYARVYYGAEYGKVHLTGKAYGVITKELRPNYPRITLEDIELEIVLLIQCAWDHPYCIFKCTPFGTGLAGFTHEQMKKLFVGKDIPRNLVLPDEWK